MADAAQNIQNITAEVVVKVKPIGDRKVALITGITGQVVQLSKG